ncbi:MAG: arginase family protein [Actinomycetota bacterium]|nr:arginase family protein [Actinomycetota bacterium]
MAITLIQVPYHLGRERVGLGAGPERLVGALSDDADVVSVARPGEFRNEVSASFDVIRALAARVREVIARRSFPVVVAGNCSSALGTVAGVGGENLGVVWFDAHGDFHTPDTSESGFLDGMALAMLTGSGWRAARGTVDGLRPVPEGSVVLVGARDLDPAEIDRFARSEVAITDRPGLASRLDRLRQSVSDVYLHVDLDVLDPAEGRANSWAAADGLSAQDAASAIDEVARRFRIRAAALTAYDPRCDPEDEVPAAAAAILARVRRGVERRETEVAAR